MQAPTAQPDYLKDIRATQEEIRRRRAARFFRELRRSLEQKPDPPRERQRVTAITGD